jgi:hypothetical protein
MPKKTPTETIFEKELRENFTQKHIYKDKPKNTAYCKVTNAISPNEIWVQEVYDSEIYFNS